jgi:hypothetical protein
VLDQAIEEGIGYLIGHFVGMTHGYGFRGKQIRSGRITLRHDNSP